MWEGMDQRRFPRAKCRCKVKISQRGSTATLATATENIGLGGVCVLLERGLDIFSTVELELVLDDSGPPMKLQGSVVWVVRRQELKKGPSFDTGIEFSGLSPQQKARLESVIDRANA